MKANLKNPKCPKCRTVMQKHGFVGTYKQRKQRFRCNNCGYTMTPK